MGKIHVLDKSVSNMIAAGEVVSRPASAVKELLENSFDAGAKSVTVEIKNGGVSYIRVTDDGSGIEEDDILTAFAPHATSKIKNAEDLFAIGTYGFRGEALASIAAVSKVELITKTANAENAVKIVCEGGEYGESESMGAPCGTTITVRDIFFNTPARFKFLKKDSAEAAAVTDVCQKAALSHPDVSVRYLSSGKEMFFTPGDSKLINAIFAVFGNDFSKHMLPLEFSKEVKVSGYIGSAAVARPNRNMQIFFVNGRPVVNKVLSFALAEAYKNQLTVGKFPSAVLNITIDPSLVDVNVHPAKTEVKFVDEHAVYDAVYWGTKDTLYQKPYVPSVNPTEEKTPEIKIAPQRTMPIFTQPKTYDAPKQSGFVKIERPSERSEIKAAEPKTEYAVKKEALPVQETIVPKQQTIVPMQETICEYKQDIKIVGQVFETYIIVQSGSEMLIIDQHAAHERLNFEALKKSREQSTPVSQMLLVPEVVSLSPSEMAVWEGNKEFFDKIGYETEAMGETDIMVRTVPCETAESISDIIVEMLTILKDSRHDKRTYVEERAMYTVACKAAIKANKVMSFQEQEHLVSEVMKLNGINTCPHGRPVCIKMSKEKIEKEFKRI